MSHYVVIGASHAGISFAEKMRQQGSQDQITIIDRLKGIPLQRPPLSKAYLSARSDEESSFYLRGADWFDAQDIALRDGVTVTEIRPDKKSICLDDGTDLGYDKLILALGAVPRRLPMAAMDSANVFVLRDGDDARALKASLPDAGTAVVIGGGYIGLEAAASLKKQGLDVHVVEAAPRLLARVASPQISQSYQELHQSHGVHIHNHVGVEALSASDDHVQSVILASGEEIACDILIVGIGVVPETSLAEPAGITIGNGIVTDYDYATNVPDIYAIGDNVMAEGRGSMRIESIHNAQYGGHYLASCITGGAKPQEEAPWFWSDQYDVKLQSAGLVPAANEDVFAVSRAGKREGGLSVWSYQGDELKSVESINDPQAYMIGKYCLEKQISPKPEDITNPDFDLKSLR